MPFALKNDAQPRIILRCASFFYCFAENILISGINGGLKAIELGLPVLFFAMSIFKSTASFRDFQRPEYALKHFIRFCAAKVAITYAMDLMTAIYSICGGIVEQIAGSLGGIGGVSVTLPAAIEQLDNDTETLMSIGRKHLCNFATLKYQQEDSMQTVLPFGTLNIKAMRTLTTENTADCSRVSRRIFPTAC